MAKTRATVRSLAAEAEIDVDEALIMLWDAGFDSVIGATDAFDRGEANRARRALGLATRRERASAEYWQDSLDMDAQGFDDLLQTLGALRVYEGGKLTKRVQHRLAAIAKQRGVTAVVEQSSGPLKS